MSEAEDRGTAFPVRRQPTECGLRIAASSVGPPDLLI